MKLQLGDRVQVIKCRIHDFESYTHLLKGTVIEYAFNILRANLSGNWYQVQLDSELFPNPYWYFEEEILLI